MATNLEVLEWVNDPDRRQGELEDAAIELLIEYPGGSTVAGLRTRLNMHLGALDADAQAPWTPDALRARPFWERAEPEARVEEEETYRRVEEPVAARTRTGGLPIPGLAVAVVAGVIVALLAMVALIRSLPSGPPAETPREAAADCQLPEAKRATGQQNSSFTFDVPNCAIAIAAAQQVNEWGGGTILTIPAGRGITGQGHVVAISPGGLITFYRDDQRCAGYQQVKREWGSRPLANDHKPTGC